MLNIAALAALDGRSFAVFGFVLPSTAFWLPSVYIGSFSGGLFADGRAQAAAFATFLAVVLGLWLMGPYRGEGDFAVSLIVVVLTVANGVGPFIVADKYRRGFPITSGHLLWEWAGLVWPAQFFLSHPHAEARFRKHKREAPAFYWPL